MNPQQNLYDMVDEMSSVISTLQGDMYKVMNGINQLNIIITKIKQYKENNNIMNNMNNQIDNMINIMPNLNMGINNMMNMPMPMPLNQNINIKDEKLILIFEFANPSPLENKRLPITIITSGDKLVKEVIEKFYAKICKAPDNSAFIFNSRKLNPDLTIYESGLINKSKILVVPPNIIG